MIICMTGMPGSGKSEAAKALIARGYKTYELGHIVWELMSKAGLERTSENAKHFATMLRKKYGKDVTAKFLLKEMGPLRGRKIVIVGIRSRAELVYIKKHAEVVTIAITAPVGLRYARVRKRSRPDDPKTLAQFIQNRDKKEIAFGILGAIKDADFIISNSGTKTQLAKNMELVVAQIA